MKLLDRFAALLFSRAAVRRDARDAAYLAEAADLNELAARMQELERDAYVSHRRQKGETAAA